jgi:hypothetical protein
MSASVSGKVLHVFAHRFVVETAHGAILADLTPKGVEQMALHVGQHVSLEGEQKPSELKVTRLTSGARSIAIDHAKKPHEHHHAPADPAIALDAARKAGFDPVGEPRRKPKHFEVTARKQGSSFELHIELDGHIRKTKPA